jgi:hypothetical protein
MSIYNNGETLPPQVRPISLPDYGIFNSEGAAEGAKHIGIERLGQLACGKTFFPERVPQRTVRLSPIDSEKNDPLTAFATSRAMHAFTSEYLP